jgi:hypothetical protein
MEIDFYLKDGVYVGVDLLFLPEARRARLHQLNRGGAIIGGAMRRLVFWAVLATSLHAQSDPGDLLLRVRDKVLNTVDRLPRYLCTQTVDREQYEPSGITGAGNCEELDRLRGTRYVPIKTTADRLRLDVGVARGSEAYSWVGENRFGDRSLFEIVQDGAVSTGYFHGFLALVFRSDHAEFSFVGEKTIDGRKRFEYGFEVPLEASHYVYRTRDKGTTTAYEGTIVADAKTADLLQLSVRTRNMAPETNACEVTTSMKYGLWRVNDADFLLPAETNLRILDGNGVESRNRTVYTGCHEFLGESTLRFGSPADEGSKPVITEAAGFAPPFPPGLTFTVRLTQDIPVASAAAGDPVQTVLTADLMDGKNVLARKGTPVTCRIELIRRYYHALSGRTIGTYEPAARVEMLLRLESLAGPAGPLPLTARPFHPTPTPLPRRPDTLAQRAISLGTLSALDRNAWSERFENAGDDFVIRSGLEMQWITGKR